LPGQGLSRPSSGGQTTADRIGAIGVNRAPAFLDVANDPLLIHDESEPPSEVALRIPNSVFLADLAHEVAQKRKLHPEVFGVTTIGGRAINTDAQYLGAGLFEFGDIILIRLQFLRSTTRECQDVEGQDHILLPLEITQSDLLVVLIRKSEIGR
jgi:hypothetical protein